MFKEIFYFFCVFVISFSFMMSISDGMDTLRFKRQADNESDVTTVNETVFSQEFTNNTAENDTLFWTLPDVTNETEAVISETENPQIELEKPNDDPSEPSENTQISNDSIPENVETSTEQQSDQTAEEHQTPEPVLEVPDPLPSNTNEKIVLHRNNCHLEIAVHEMQDLKIQIKFDPLQSNSAGRCCITLNSHEDSMLGVILSDIHLYHNGSQGEVLKVIVKSYDSAFVLKEYYGASAYQPLLLTETNRVYIMLYYKVGIVSINRDYSHFNLEAFTYHKYENNIHNNMHNEDSYYSAMNYYNFK